MKNVVITGSTRGIGLEMALEFLRAGCNVTVCGRHTQLPDAAQTELENFANQYNYVPCDVQSTESLEQLWEESAKKWKTVDIWINNAGQNAPHRYIWETEERYTENVIKTNIFGMILGSQIAVEHMLRQGYGAIYSMEGLGSNNMIQVKTVLYGTSKHALTYFMKGLAKELEGTGVIAGRLSPGMMLTEFITKDPDGERSDVLKDERFKKIFNILADTPQTVAKFFIPRILANTKNGKQIIWLTNKKAVLRFMGFGRRRERLIP